MGDFRAPNDPNEKPRSPIDWDDGDNWPTTEAPTTGEVNSIMEGAEAIGGRVTREAHAGRQVTMKFPHPAVENGQPITRKVPRAECRRRGIVNIPVPHSPTGALAKVCVTCDAVNLWPSAATLVE